MWRCQHTETRDDTTDDELRKAVGRTLQQSTNNHNKRTDENGLATPQVIPNPDSRNRTDKAPQVVRCHGDALARRLRVLLSRVRDIVVRRTRRCDSGKDAVERLESQETASHTLIVAKQKKVHAGNDTDGDLEGIAPKTNVISIHRVEHTARASKRESLDIDGRGLTNIDKQERERERKRGV